MQLLPIARISRALFKEWLTCSLLKFPDFSFDGDDVKFDGETEAAQKQTGKLAHSRRQVRSSHSLPTLAES